jgi:hypothetical protein
MMPVYVLSCPDCGHVAQTLVLEGCRMPSEWLCGRCASRRMQPAAACEPHPWEASHGSGCLCCGPAPSGILCQAVE